MEIQVSAFCLLYCEIWFTEGRLEYICSVVLYCVARDYCWCLVFSVFVFYLSGFVVKVLPYHICWFFPVSFFYTFVTLNNCQLLFFQTLLLFDEGGNIFGSILNHLQKVIDSVLWDRSLLRIILKCKHLADYSLLQYLDWFHCWATFFKVGAMHVLLYII